MSATDATLERLHRTDTAMIQQYAEALGISVQEAGVILNEFRPGLDRLTLIASRVIQAREVLLERIESLSGVDFDKFSAEVIKTCWEANTPTEDETTDDETVLTDETGDSLSVVLTEPAFPGDFEPIMNNMESKLVMRVG